jgi:hypothetical protein
VCNTALELNPEVGMAENYLGLASYYQKDFPEAVKHCGKALALGFQVDPALLKELEPYVPKKE